MWMIAVQSVAKLKVWGQGLFNAVFSDRSADRLFNEFQDENVEGRQISIAASQPEILRLPWELLCDPKGTYLVHEQPRIALRRQLAGAGGGRKPLEVKPKAQLRLLMVVSRPDGAGFIDPRSEAQAVLQAIEKAFVQGTRRITIAGFGGQGKTYLAVEAGRWLSQTGMFEAVVFVDYAAFQGVDAVGMAVSTIGVVLEQSFIDTAAVTKALPGRRTLIILDNLETGV
jgi:hypothetical protein